MDQIAMMHLSDLHFGRVLVNNEFSWMNRGWNAHDYRLCQALQPSFDEVKVLFGLQQSDSPHLIVSGDLTRVGAPGDFPIAHTFLRSKFRVRRTAPASYIGAGSRDDIVAAVARNHDDMVAAVAGNHDHWDGRKLLPNAYNPRITPDHFRPTPWKKEWSSGRICLELYGLDSNAGLRGSNLNAAGMLDTSDLEKLIRCLNRSNDKTRQPDSFLVRAIVMHHSMSYAALPYPGLRHIKALDEKSRDALMDIARDFGISAILTGHTHDFYYRSLSGAGRPFWEFRCASTLKGPVSTEAGFLAHRIRLANGRPQWETWRFGYDGARFVKNSTKPCAAFEVG